MSLVAWKLAPTSGALMVAVWYLDDDDTNCFAVVRIGYDEGRRVFTHELGDEFDADVSDELRDELTRLDGSEFGPIKPKRMLRKP